MVQDKTLFNHMQTYKNKITVDPKEQATKNASDNFDPGLSSI